MTIEHDEDSFAGRLRILIGHNSVRAFAKEVGIGPSTIQKYLDGAMPGLENLVVISRKKRVTMDWLALGEGPVHLGADESAQVRQGSGNLPDDFTLIPRLDVRTSAGPGTLVESEGTTEMLAFRSDWLRRMGINPRAAHVLTNKGDSMEPTIRDGDILLVDSSIDRVIDSAIYVVVFGARTLLKRVQPMRDGSIVLSSDNAAYQSEVVPVNEVPELIIAARLMWFGRSI